MLMDDRAEPSGLIVPNQSLTLPSTAGTMTYSDDFDIKKLMDEAVDPLTGMMRDLRVDDRDLPLAKNFFEFSTEFSKSNPPWARQMLIMTILFGEFCPRCSDKKWLRLENVDPSFPTRELPERIQFLNYGKCPKCKATKLELYKSGEINLYKELVLVWGQRCVVGGTVVLTEDGLQRIGDIGRDKPYGFSPFKLGLHNGNQIEESSQFFRAVPETVHRATFSDGRWIEGTADHPIKTANRGFVKIPDLVPGDYINVQLGTSIYGKLDSNLTYGGEDRIPNIVLMGTKDSQIRYLSSLFGSGFVYQPWPFCRLYSKQMVLDTVAMLDNMGIVSRIIHHSDGTYTLKLLMHLTERRVYVKSITQHEAEETFDFHLPETHQFIANGIVIHNSGKSVTGMAGAGYLAHRWLKYPRISTIAPEQVQNFTPLSATFVALTFSRAVSLLWAPFMNLINNTPWFDDYHKMLDHYGEKYGVPLYRKKEIFIKYFHKNLHFYPMHPNASVLRGDTRIFGAIDELGMFPMEKRKNTDEADTVSERANAREALLSLDNSLATMFAVTMSLIKKGYHHTPPVMLMGLSSPKHLRDMVMQRFRASQKGEMSRLMLGSQMATWDINPFLGRNSEYIRGKFDDDPIAAQRDLGAQPPRIAHTFIHRNQILGRKWPFTGAPNALKLNYEFGDLEDAEDMWARLMNGHTGKLPHPSVMSLDAGMVDNSFSVASTHYDQKTGKYIASVILEVIPQHGRTINFNRLYKELLLPFARATSAQIVVADRWQSVDILHRFKDDIPGIAVKQKSLRRYEFDEAMHIIKNGNYVLPFLDQNSKEVQKILDSGGEGVQDYRTEMVNRPIHHLLWQMLTLQDVGPTACPEKGEDCTDDNFRAAFLGLIAITQPQVADILIKHPVKYVDQESNAQLVSLFISRGGARLM